MVRKIFAPVLLLMLAVAVVSLLVVGIRRLVIASASEKEKFCGTITRLAGQLNSKRWVAIVDDGKLIVQVPSLAAYNRLMVGKEFTFVYRRGELIAIGDGNLCKK